MTEPTLYRASTELEVKGRTLEGLAIPWDTWAVVQDLRGPAYPEAHARSNFDESLRRDPGPRPLYSTHEYAFDPTAEPIGVAHFERASNALMFRAFLSKTRKADEQRELILDGAKRAVSVGFRPVKTRQVQRPEGAGRLRVESMLRELSIAPTGFGQYPEARIMAMRSDADEDPARLMAALDAAIDAAMQCLDPTDDNFNAAQAYDTLVAAEVTVDALLALFGIVDPDDVDAAVRSVVAPPATDQLLRMRAGRPLLRPKD